MFFSAALLPLTSMLYQLKFAWFESLNSAVVFTNNIFDSIYLYLQDLVVHVGVNVHSSEIALETKSCAGPYNIPDVNDCCAPCEHFDCDIETKLRLCDVPNELRQIGVECELSYDCGCYLCGYIYMR